MRIGDFVRMNKEMMNLLSNHNVKMDDFKYVDLFEDYERMAKDGNKISYIVTCLSEKYDMCEASVYRILKKFKVTL